MRTQTDADISILTAIIITLCGCTMIAAAFGAVGSLLAGIVFGGLAGFWGGAWFVARRAQWSPEAPPPPVAPVEPPAPARQSTRQTQPQRQVQAQQPAPSVSPVSNEW